MDCRMVDSIRGEPLAVQVDPCEGAAGTAVDHTARRLSRDWALTGPSLGLDWALAGTFKAGTCLPSGFSIGTTFQTYVSRSSAATGARALSVDCENKGLV